jgi:hypothetical protein
MGTQDAAAGLPASVSPAVRRGTPRRRANRPGGRSEGRLAWTVRISAVLLALATMLLCAAAAQAWVHRQSQWWTYYLPTPRWVAATSAAGIDISSPTGALGVSEAYSATPDALTNQQIVNEIVSAHGLDTHPIASLRFTSESGYKRSGQWLFRTYQWTAVRTDRHQGVRGVLTTGVYSGAGTYGAMATCIVAPTSVFAQQYSLLETILSRIRFIPQG